MGNILSYVYYHSDTDQFDSGEYYRGLGADLVEVFMEDLVADGYLRRLEHYRTLLSDLPTLRIDSTLREWRADRVQLQELNLGWLPAEWYTVERTDTIPKFRVEVPDSVAYSKSDALRILAETAILYSKELNITVPDVPSMYRKAIQSRYSPQNAYLLCSLLKVLNRDYVNSRGTLNLTKILDVQLPSLAIDHEMTNEQIERVVLSLYPDRSDCDEEYRSNVYVDIPFSYKDYNCIVKAEPHSEQHEREAAIITMSTGKKTVILNVYEGVEYRVTSTLDHDIGEKMLRLMRANLLLQKSGLRDVNSPDLLMVVDAEHNGEDTYEYGALVYDRRLGLIVDCIVLTHPKARVNDKAVVNIPDGPDCHRFVVDSIGKNALMEEEYKRFVDKYRSATLLHYGGAEGKDPLYQGMTIVDVMKLYSKVNDCSWNRQRFVLNRVHPDIKTILFHRAFDDCISTLLIGLSLPLTDAAELLKPTV